MIRVVTAAAAYPVLRSEAKEWCRIDAADQDNVVDLLIAAMTNYAEHLTGRAFVERTLELNLIGFKGCIELPWPPLIGIDSIVYTDSDEAAQTVDAADYEVDTVSMPGRVRPISTASWPAIGTRFNPVRIQYRAGYHAVGSPVTSDTSYLPPELRTWIAARISTLFENREHLIVNNQIEIPRVLADGLLDSLIIGTRFF